jgi:archaellum biogenesis protein FlaJ (TadC family)
MPNKKLDYGLLVAMSILWGFMVIRLFMGLNDGIQTILAISLIILFLWLSIKIIIDYNKMRTELIIYKNHMPKNKLNIFDIVLLLISLIFMIFMILCLVNQITGVIDRYFWILMVSANILSIWINIRTKYRTLKRLEAAKTLFNQAAP